MLQLREALQSILAYVQLLQPFAVFDWLEGGDVVYAENCCSATFRDFDKFLPFCSCSG